ncbi:MAG: PAS domain S-box protein [Oligoflexia bacterium]|nr:PAS domain S-box protein [Oligoflexia bacterium]
MSFLTTDSTTIIILLSTLVGLLILRIIWMTLKQKSPAYQNIPSSTSVLHKDVNASTAYLELLRDVAITVNRENFSSAIEQTLALVCQFVGWPIGHVYLRSTVAAQTLISAQAWYLASPSEFAEFKQVSENLALDDDNGLPGLVMTKKKPVWVPDVRVYPKFVRKEIAKKLGIVSGFGFPIMMGDKIGGIIELYSKENKNLTPDFIDLMSQVGTMLGRVVERQISDDALKQSEKKFRSVSQSANDAIISCDTNGEVISWNHGAEVLFGYLESETIGQNLKFIMPERFRKMHQMGMDRMNSTGEKRIFKTVELMGLRKGAIEFPIELSLSDWLQGDKRFYSAIIRDITERKAAEDTIRNSEVRLRHLINAVHDTICTTDGKGIITSMSPGFETLTGWRPDEFIGKDFPQLIHPDDLPRVMALFQETVLNKKAVTFETRSKSKSGEYIPIESSAQALMEGDNVIGTISVVRDISQRRKTEEERKARELLERTNKELEQFAYISSHDLQEPLRMVGSYALLLENRYKDKLDNDGKEFIQYIVEGATRMHELIHDLLAFSRLASPEHEFLIIDVHETFDRAVKNLALLIDESKVQITADKFPKVKGNVPQLSQVFQNLISNAIKFRGSEPLKIDIKVTEKENKWEFAVKDNGIGFDPMHADRIFIVFKRLHSKEIYKGTGIGLATVKKIIERHGGQVWATSEPSRGSIFYFTLPKI